MKLWRTLNMLIVLAVLSVMPAGPASAQNGAAAAKAADRRPVLLISIDGMRPDAVLEADKYGLKIPVLRRFLKEGSHAQEVLNVNPTVTNPNHTTLVTGVLPAEHGIVNNRPFAPLAKLPKGFGSYSQIKAPTLWGAAKKAGLTTASIFWPVTRDAADIDFNLMEGSDEDDAKIAADAVALIEQKRPDFLTLHFVTFDHKEHEFGPFTPEAHASLERIDTAVGQVIAAQRKAHPNTVIVIASDHGFFTVTHQVNLNAAMVEAGFITLSSDPEPVVTSWRAFIWYVGGMAMAVLNDPEDQQTRAQLDAFLRKLAADPANGIERIYGREEIAGLGLSAEAESVVALKVGYRMGNAMTGPLVQPAKGGAHGAFSTRTLRPDMRSSFLITGPGIPAGKNLGQIDMRQIAPTIAGYLKVSLPSAKMPALSLGE
ncbi:alkaline phosphatase family protein [Sphingomonas soli]|uniref:alkaline phosphatase family protein n=1 Tax=Sphingomonas soli TaxID=266127 RepID=UPI0009FC48B8|nr:ectonucleotide pyrophosphatase/phosphodiesterase [Sphingomonas soli]